MTNFSKWFDQMILNIKTVFLNSKKPFNTSFMFIFNYLKNSSAYIIPVFFTISVLNLGILIKSTFFATSTDTSTADLLEKVLILQQLQASQIDSISQSINVTAINPVVPVVVEEVVQNTWLPYIYVVGGVVGAVGLALLVKYLYDVYGSNGGSSADSVHLPSEVINDITASQLKIKTDIVDIAGNLRVLSMAQVNFDNQLKNVKENQVTMCKSQNDFVDTLQTFIKESSTETVNRVDGGWSADSVPVPNLVGTELTSKLSLIQQNTETLATGMRDLNKAQLSIEGAQLLLNDNQLTMNEGQTGWFTNLQVTAITNTDDINARVDQAALTLNGYVADVHTQITAHIAAQARLLTTNIQRCTDPLVPYIDNAFELNQDACREDLIFGLVQSTTHLDKKIEALSSALTKHVDSTDVLLKAVTHKTLGETRWESFKLAHPELFVIDTAATTPESNFTLDVTDFM